MSHHPAAIAALWSAAMLASFVGWGAVVNFWLAPNRIVDLGLRAGWGMALFVLTGGFLCLAHLAVGPVLMAQVGVGVMALSADWARRAHRPRWAVRTRRRLVVSLGRAGLVLLVASIYAAAFFTLVAYLGNHDFQESDDLPFYFTMPEKLVQTGSMFEPYAARRATSFGGQIYLHAAFVSVAPIYFLQAVDAGIAFVVVTALLDGHVRCSEGRARIAARHALALGLAVLLLFTLRKVRVNTASLMTGVAAIITLYRTLRVPLAPGWQADRPAWPIEPRRIVALAGSALVPIVLRTSNAAAVLPFVASVFASDFFLSARRPWTRPPLLSLAKAFGLFAGAFVLLLAPWSILMWHSCGTLFFPISKGNVTPGWVFLVHPTSLASDAIMHVFHGRPVAFLAPFALAGLLPLRGRARNDLAALTAASVLGFLAQARESAAFGEENTARYYFAYVAATTLLVAASVGRDTARTTLVAVGLAVHLTVSRDDTRDTLIEQIKDAKELVRKADTDLEAFRADSDPFLELQSYLPPRETMVTAVLEPFRFDFKRNDIQVLDFLGGMGPKPGWPYRQGPEALGRYLVANGAHYLVWADFDLPSGLYNKARWTGHLALSGVSYLKGEAAIQLDAENAIEKLTEMRRVVFRGNKMTVVDLTRPRDPAP